MLRINNLYIIIVFLLIGINGFLPYEKIFINQIIGNHVRRFFLILLSCLGITIHVYILFTLKSN